MDNGTCTRIAGALYLLIIACGISSEIAVRAALIVPHDPAVTAANILAAPGLFRSGFVLDTVMLLCDVAVALLLLRIFGAVNKPLAITAAVFRLVQASIVAASLLLYYAALPVLLQREFASLDAQALASLLLQLHGYGYDLGLIFFAVSNAVIGFLVIRSQQVPDLLGYGLMAASLVYWLGSFSHFLFPHYWELLQPAYLVPLVAELGFAIWLVAKGSTATPPPRA